VGLKADHVTGTHPPVVLEAKYLVEHKPGLRLAIGGAGLTRCHFESMVVPGQEVLQYVIGFLQRAGSCQTKLGYQPVLEGTP